MNSTAQTTPTPPKTRLLGMRARRAVGNTVGQVILTALSILWIIPLFYLLVQSFRAEPGAWSPGFFPQTWTLDNYKRLFTETDFPRWYGNTLLIAVVSCTITTLFVLAVSYAFSRIRFRARRPMMNVMLILGMELLAIGTWMYMKSALGSGPRDALMVVLARKTKRSVGLCRASVEILVIIAGWLLGGQVGIGTVITGIGVGTLFNLNFALLRFKAADLHQENLPETLRRLRGAKTV